MVEKPKTEVHTDNGLPPSALLQSESFKLWREESSIVEEIINGVDGYGSKTKGQMITR